MTCTMLITVKNGKFDAPVPQDRGRGRRQGRLPLPDPRGHDQGARRLRQGQRRPDPSDLIRRPRAKGPTSDNFLTFTVAGLATAAIYAIAASGLVVTYTTSGIFNFAHGAFGMMAAFTYWQVHDRGVVPTIPSVILVVFILAPLFGALVERVIMRGVEGAPEVVKIVVTVSPDGGVARPGAGDLAARTVARPVTPFFAGTRSRSPASVLGYQRLLTMAVALAVALGLRLVLNRTRSASRCGRSSTTGRCCSSTVVGRVGRR